MGKIVRFSDLPRRHGGAAAPAALIPCFAEYRRGPDDVFWLKENAELLNVFETTGQNVARYLGPYEEVYANLPERMRFFPQYYRFLLSICLDLEDLGLPGRQGTPMARWVAANDLIEAELSDLQRAEAVRLLSRRGVAPKQRDEGLNDRLRAFAERTDTFTLPNRKAAYELTHLVFYLSEYGRRNPALGDAAIDSLHFAGIIAVLEENTDLLAEICIAMRFAGHIPPAAWEAWIGGRLRMVRIEAGGKGPVGDTYHDWLMAQWSQALSGHAPFSGSFTPGRLGFHMPAAAGPLRGISAELMRMGDVRSADWGRMRPRIVSTLGEAASATLCLAETSKDRFEAFFARFARAGAGPLSA